jgi:hypothetical protein
MEPNADAANIVRTTFGLVAAAEPFADDDADADADPLSVELQRAFLATAAHNAQTMLVMHDIHAAEALAQSTARSPFEAAGDTQAPGSAVADNATGDSNASATSAILRSDVPNRSDEFQGL